MRRKSIAVVLLIGLLLMALIIVAGALDRAQAFSIREESAPILVRDLLDMLPPRLYIDRAAKPAPLKLVATDEEITMIAQTMWAEARGLSKMEILAVGICVLNRVLDPRWPDTVSGVLRQPHQFAWTGREPVDDVLLSIAMDATILISREVAGEVLDNRVLPREYVYFAGDGRHNYFRTAYRGGTVWDWSLPDPYAEG